MPELPEVETARRGIAPHLVGRRIRRLEVREWRLRWPISRRLPAALRGRAIEAVGRRGKYLLIRAGGGTLLWHLGMSGSLRVLADPPPPGPHDHVDLELSGGTVLRFRDPRRFGSLHWIGGDPLRHRLLAGLGPEPLGEDFGGDWLHARSRGRRAAVKTFLMDARVVVGVGNIYASEALFEAGVAPSRPAGRISRARYGRLAEAVREVLARSIEAGGTTLRDFTEADGRPGYFARELRVYGRAGEPCVRCGEPVRVRTLGQRSSFYCPRCQR